MVVGDAGTIDVVALKFDQIICFLPRVMEKGLPSFDLSRFGVATCYRVVGCCIGS